MGEEVCCSEKKKEKEKVGIVILYTLLEGEYAARPRNEIL